MTGVLYYPKRDSSPDLPFQGPLPLCPVLGRYRLIDFALSNLSNGGVGTVGILAPAEDQPHLAAYIGVGQEWDLDRRRGGISWLSGSDDSCSCLAAFLKAQSGPYVILADASLAWTLSCRELFYDHLESGCDLTTAYGSELQSPGLYLLSRGLLLTLLDHTGPEPSETPVRQIEAALASGILTQNRVMVPGPCLSAQSWQTYYRAHMELLPSCSQPSPPMFAGQIYTRQQDEPPAFFGPEAQAENSQIAGGCRILGSVSESSLFGNVFVQQNARVQGCLLHPGCRVEAGADLQYVLAGADCRFSAGTVLKGTPEDPVIIKRGVQL